jgi:Fe2+ transport system protein FeoA
MQRVRQRLASWHTSRGIHTARHESIAPLAAPLPGACLLSTLSAGERATVVALTGGRGSLGKMASLGFTPGVEIVWLRGIRVALGRHEAQHVQVRRSL